MATTAFRLTCVQREALESVRRAAAAPYDSVRLREEITARTAIALPSDVSAMATADPQLGVFTHGMTWNYPADLLDRYYKDVYPREGAAQFIRLVRSGELASTHTGPVESDYLRVGGMGSKLHVALAEQGKMWGAWCLTRRAGAPAFTERDAEFAALLSPMIAAALRRAALMAAADERDSGAEVSEPTAPGVAVYDARGRLQLRDARASHYMADLADADRPDDIPVPVASALTQLWWRLRAPLEACDARADAGVRIRGRSGRWYVVHASVAEGELGVDAGQVMVVLTPLAGGERANVLAQLYGLSPREREIATRIARGESGKQIAAALGLSAHTVQAHIDNACGKIGARGRRELVAKLFVGGAAARLAS